ncbi:hypothetical protein Trydic_g12427 [Trypoxylus dichotomus]
MGLKIKYAKERISRKERLAHHGHHNRNKIILNPWTHGTAGGKPVIVRRFKKKDPNFRENQLDWKKRHVAFETFAKRLNATIVNDYTTMPNLQIMLKRSGQGRPNRNTPLIPVNPVPTALAIQKAQTVQVVQATQAPAAIRIPQTAPSIRNVPTIRSPQSIQAIPANPAMPPALNVPYIPSIQSVPSIPNFSNAPAVQGIHESQWNQMVQAAEVTQAARGAAAAVAKSAVDTQFQFPTFEDSFEQERATRYSLSSDRNLLDMPQSTVKDLVPRTILTKIFVIPIVEEAQALRNFDLESALKSANYALDKDMKRSEPKTEVNSSETVLQSSTTSTTEKDKMLFAHVSLTVSVKDSHFSATRRVRNGNTFSPAKLLYRNHPSLRHVTLTDNMRSLLYGLRRKKRMPHHGRSNKILRTTIAPVTVYKTTTRPPLINVNDIESFIYRQKHQCNMLKENNDVIPFDSANDPISLVRRAVATESTSSTTITSQATSTFETSQPTTVTHHDIDEHRNTRAAAAEFPIIITEIVEVGPQSTEQVTVQRRQVSEEPPTTCITISASTETITAAGGAVDVAVTTPSAAAAPNGENVTPVAVGAETDVVTTSNGVGIETGAPTVAPAGAVLTEAAQPPPTEAQVIPPAEAQTVPAALTAPPETPVAAPIETPAPAPAEAPTALPPEASSAPAGPPTLQVNDDFGGGKVVMTTHTFAAMATTAGALVGAPKPQSSPIDTGKLSQTLDEILESVESLADQKQTANEDFPCHVNGSWISEAGGVRLEITHKTNNTLDVAISDAVGRSKKTSTQGFLSRDSWTITGIIPLEKKSMVILNAVNGNENQLATFIGECKVCHHTETMTGHWLQVRSGRDCNDQKDSFKILGDLWRREILHDLKKQRQRLHLSNAHSQARSSDASNQDLPNDLVQSTIQANGKTKALVEAITRTTCIVIDTIKSK